MKQFEEEIAYPFKMNQYQASLLQGMPLETQSYSYAQPSGLANILSNASGIADIGGAGGLGGGIMDAITSLFGGSSGAGSSGTTTDDIIST